MLSSQTRWVFHTCAAATVIGLWMLTQPYSGLRHDAILYLAQALKWSRPDQFNQDIFFAFGSQDRYSIYALIFGPIFEQAEVQLVQPLVFGACHAAFLAAIWRLLPDQLGLRQRWLCLAALVLLRPLYGGLSIFSYCEPFLTARTLAEPLALWSLVCLHQQDRPWTAWLLMVLATLIHPLMSLPIAGCLWLMCCVRDRRWLILLPLAGGVVAALTLLGKPPFDGLLKQYPDDWWKLVATNDQVLVKNWRSSNWAAIAVSFAILLGAWPLYRDRHKSLIPALLVSVGVLLALVVLGSQIYRNVLITQLQLWRGLWLVRALAVALTPTLLLAIARKGRSGPATAASMATVVSMANLQWDSAWIGMLWPALHLWIWRTQRSVSTLMLRVSVATSVLAILAIGVSDYFHQRAIPVDDAIFLDFSPLGIALIVSALPALAALAWLWQAHWRARAPLIRKALAYGLPASAIALALTGALLWDRRPPLERYLESHLHTPHPFEAFVPEGTEVYWDNSLAAAWFLLKRPSYYSPAQGAGALFNEATARAWDQRHQAFRALGRRRTSCEVFTMLLGKLPNGSAPCYSLAEHEIQGICQMAADLQFVVSAEPYSHSPLAVWNIPQGHGPLKTQYLYACSSFR
ncbi:hypothetical protein J2X20_003227 [Pelomonas saccharophila]|uniref:Uncharacterized protein n=1 Tax=Roseateles saccharophilus TaxID=304 RepID=A0ABU1YNZ7_ROSSA|nr:hypothetical protein [Roseateles saccharophilus]MDR7270569.1 hypothetical protein [Roseateles saccharophilus]